MSKKTGLSKGGGGRRSRVVKKEGPDALEQLFQYQSGRTQDDVGALVEATGTAETHTLLAIRPDPNQPRLFLPRGHYERLWRGEDPRSILQSWVASKSTAHPAEQQAIDSLRSLANTIEEVGLIQAITIRDVPTGLQMPAGVTKLIITGERRWWAHVLLLSEGRQAGPRTAEQIKATAFNTNTILAVQMIENMQREGLNAVERAAGIKALKEELAVSRGKDVTWVEIEKMLGIDKPYRYRVLKVLDLAPDVQQKIVEYGLTESAVRPIAEKLKKRPDLQVKAVNRLIAWREAESGGNLKAYIDSMLLAADSTDRREPVESVGLSKLASTVQKKSEAAAKAIGKLSAQDVSQLRLLLENEPNQALQLVELRNRLNRILDDTEAGTLYVIRMAHGGYFETDSQPGGIIGYESRLAAQIDSAAMKGTTVESLPAERFAEFCRQRNRPGVVATTSGQVMSAG